MWVTYSPTTGEKMEMPDITRCFLFYPQFLDDFHTLIDNGVIKHIAFDHYEWTKSKTSLAEYFDWLREEYLKMTGEIRMNVKGGLWAPVESTFRIKGKPIKRGSLTKLAGDNGNPLKPKKSKNLWYGTGKISGSEKQKPSS